MAANHPNAEGLTALYINCTLKKSPGRSNTEGLIDKSRHIIEKNGGKAEVLG